MSQIPAFTTPEAVESAFYEAIAAHDADTLMRYWSDDEELLCVHPTGVRLTGQASIYESWRSIFSSATLRLEYETLACWQGSVMAVHHLTEIIYLADDPNPHGPLYVTHYYMRGAHGWRLVCRHASPADDGHQAMADALPHTLH